MKTFLKLSLALGLGLSLIQPAFSQNLVTFNTTGLSGSEVSFNGTNATGVLSTSFSRGSGLTMVSNPNQFGAQGWSTDNYTAAQSGNDFFTFRAVAAANYSLSFTNVGGTFFRNSNRGPTRSQWAIGGTAVGSEASIANSTNFNHSAALSGYNNLITSLEFRYVAYGDVAGPIDPTRLFLSGTLNLVGTANLRSTSNLIWDGGRGDGNWNSFDAYAANQSNWNNNWLPTTTFVDNLQFAGSTQTTTNNNISGLTVGSLAFNSGAAAFVLNGNALSLNSGISNLSTNTQTVNLGLNLGGAQTFSATNGNLVLGGPINTGGFDVIVTGGSNTTITGGITGDGGLTKNGAGTLNMNSAGDLGNISVTAGRLIVGSTATVDSTAVSVTGGSLTVNGTLDIVGNLNVAGGTVDGSGSISADVVIDSGSTLAPGNSIDSLQIVGNLTMNSGSTFDFEIDTALVDADLLSVSGNVTLNSANLLITDLGGDQALTPFVDKFTLIDYTGFTLTGQFSGLSNNSIFALGSNLFQINYFDSGAVTISAVPEANALILGVVATTLGAFRRRRRK